MSSETTESYMCFMFSIACKINLGLIKIMEIQEGEGGGLWPWKSGWEGGQLIQEIRSGGGGVKKPCHPLGGCGFFLE